MLSSIQLKLSKTPLTQTPLMHPTLLPLLRRHRYSKFLLHCETPGDDEVRTNQLTPFAQGRDRSHQVAPLAAFPFFFFLFFFLMLAGNKPKNISNSLLKYSCVVCFRKSSPFASPKAAPSGLKPRSGRADSELMKSRSLSPQHSPNYDGSLSLLGCQHNDPHP